MSEELRSQAEILAAISQAREDLSAGLAELQASVDQLNERPVLTEEEQRALEEQAGSGELGDDMQLLVEKVKGGEDSWEQVFSGESPHAHLLQGHLTAMFEEHKEDLALAFEELIEAEEGRGNFLFDEVPSRD